MLSAEVYADNLCSYLSAARFCKTITIEDLNNVIHGIAERLNRSESDTQTTRNEEEVDNLPITSIPIINSIFLNDLILGEHVIAFWNENDGQTKWYLGIVEGFSKDSVVVSYMTRGKGSEATDQIWAFPEHAEVLETSFDQILAFNVKVQYLGSVRIRCKIDENLIADLNDMINKIN